MLKTAEGIVIRSIDYGEGNKIITLFTKENGKVGLMVRGAKKVRSRHAAVTQLFTHAQFDFYKSGQMGSLNAAEIINAFQSIREDLYTAAYTSYMAEMVDRMVGDSEGSAFLFGQFSGGLAALDEGKDMQIVTHVFELKMLAFGGYMPVLEVCVSCGRTEGGMAFSAAMGGIVCPLCRGKDLSAIPLAEGSWKLLKLLAQVDIRRLGRIEVKESTRQQLKQCIQGCIDHYIGIRWKSRSVLDQLEKYKP